MATIQNNIRWASNTDELKRNLMDGVNTLDVMKQAVDRTAVAMSGTGLFGQANKVAAAIQQLGSVTKLTTAEQERHAATLDRAIEKYKAMGIEAPKALLDIRSQLTRATQSSQELTTSMVALGSAVGTMVGKFAGDAIVRLGGMFTDAIGSAFKMNASLETTTLKFTTLMHDSDKAAAHVKDLFEIAKKTPFETGPIIEASLKLQTFGGAALNTKENIMLLGDASAATGAPINELGFWVGRLYAMVQGGKPFGEAAMRLQELAVLTPQARDKMEALQKSGASATDVFNTFKESLGQFSGAMATQAGTWEGVMSTFTDTVNIMMADVLKPYFEVIRDLGREVNNQLDAMSTSMGGVSTSTADTKKAFADFIGSGLNVTIKSLSYLMVEFNAAQVVLRDVLQLVDMTAVAFKTLSLAVAQAGSLGGRLGPFADDVKRITGELAMLDKRILERGDALKKDKQAEEDWIAWGDKAVETVDKMLAGVGKATEAVKVHGQAQAATTETTKKLTAEQKAWQNVLDEVNSAGEDWRATLRGIDAAVADNARALLEAGVSAQTVGKYYGLTATQVRALQASMKDEEAVAKRVADEHSDNIQIAGELTRQFAGLRGTLMNLAVAMGDVQLGSKQIGVGFMALMPDLGAQAAARIREGLDNGLSEAFEHIPDILMRAFEGGGGLLGGLKAIGVQIADTITGPLLKKLSDGTKQAIGYGASAAAAFGGAFGGGAGATIGGIASSVAGLALSHTALASSTVALGAATAGIGAAAVGVYLLAKHFLSVSAAEKEARKSFEEFNTALGGKNINDFIARVSQAGAVLEMDGEIVRQMIQKVLDATHKSPQALAEALKPLADLIDAADKKTAALAKGTDAVTEAFQKAGGRIPASLRASLEALVKMKGLTDDQRKALQGLLDQSAPNFQALTDKAAGFGITIDALGPKFQQVQIEARSKDLANFLQDATEAGGDVGGMLAGLSDEISALVNDSIKFGTAIPDNMKPYIEELIRAGKLTDESGQKIDDITGISFEATPLDEGLKGLTDAIEDLIKLLTDGVTGALDKVADKKPGPIHIPVTWDVPDLPKAGYDGGNPYASSGGLVTAFGIQRFAMGGFVGYGTDTVPAMLTPGEAVLNQHATAILGADAVRQLNRGEPVAKRGDTTVVVVRVDTDKPEAIFDALPYRIKHNVRGLRTQIIQAVG